MAAGELRREEVAVLPPDPFKLHGELVVVLSHPPDVAGHRYGQRRLIPLKLRKQGEVYLLAGDVHSEGTGRSGLEGWALRKGLGRRYDHAARRVRVPQGGV